MSNFCIRTEAESEVHLGYDDDGDIVLYVNDDPVCALRQCGDLYLFPGVSDDLGLKLDDNGSIALETDS